jgi:hypothetical protein
MCMMQPVKTDQQLFYTTVKVGWHRRGVSFLAAHPLHKKKRIYTADISGCNPIKVHP